MKQNWLLPIPGFLMCDLTSVCTISKQLSFLNFGRLCKILFECAIGNKCTTKPQFSSTTCYPTSFCINVFDKSFVGEACVGRDMEGSWVGPVIWPSHPNVPSVLPKPIQGWVESTRPLTNLPRTCKMETAIKCVKKTSAT